MGEEYKGKVNTYRVSEVKRTQYVIEKLVGTEWKEEYNEGYWDTLQDAIDVVKDLIFLENS